MEGITVLTEASPMSFVLAIFFPVFAFFAIIGIGIFLGVCLGATIKDRCKGVFGKVVSGLVCGTLIVISIVFAFFTADSIDDKIIERNRSYKITIDDSVSFNEFNAKYKVLKQDGQIFTVVEREVDENETNS